MQQRIAELTAEAEENVSRRAPGQGVRARGAPARALRRRDAGACSTSRWSRRGCAPSTTRSSASCPSSGSPAILLVGGRQAINGTITIGEFVAFYGYVLMLTSPVRMLGIALGMAQRAVASGARVFEMLDRAPAMTVARRRARRCPTGDGRVELRGVTVRLRATRRADRAATGSTSTSRPAGRSRSSARPGRARRRSCRSIPRLYDPTSGTRRRSTASTSARSTSSRCGARSRWSPTTRSCSPRRCARTSPTRARTRPTRRSSEAARQRGHPRLHRRPARRLRDARRRARPDALGRPAPARSRSRARCCADPRILILDDATSSVDATTEAEIKNALRGLMRARTTFIIGHRLSTIALADEIVVLEDGRDRRARHPRRAARDLRRSTARSPRRGCPTRSS